MEELNDLLTRQSTLDSVQAVPLNGLDQAGKEANEQLVMLERKHTDALRNYAELREMLPSLEISVTNDLDDSGAMAQIITQED